MNSSEIIALINELETRYSVAEWVADGIHVWPLFRVRLYASLVFAGLGGDAAPRGTGKAARAREMLRSAIRSMISAMSDREHNAKSAPKTTALLFSDGVSYARVGRVWYDRMMDPLVFWLENRGHRYLVLTPMAEGRVPRRTPGPEAAKAPSFRCRSRSCRRGHVQNRQACPRD